MKMVHVEWEDATEQTAGAWAACIVETIGYVVHDLEEGLVLTDSHTPSLFGRVTQIPRGMIRKVTELRKAR